MNVPSDAKLTRLFDCLEAVGESKLVDLPAVQSWPATKHSFHEDDLWAIRAALAAGRPLLLRGEPGIGKSQLARSGSCLRIAVCLQSDRRAQ